MGKRIVIALGGNALGENLPEQMAAVRGNRMSWIFLFREIFGNCALLRLFFD